MSSPNQLPQVAADVVATLIGALPGRLAKRVDALAAQAESWSCAEISPGRTSVAVAGETVTLEATDGAVRSVEQVGCSCLLSPRCAHVGAVLRAAPVTPGSATETPAVASGEPVAGNRLTQTDLAAVEVAEAAVAALLRHGAAHAGPQQYADLLSGLHRLRVAGLVSAASGMAALTEQVRRRGTGAETASRDALVAAACRTAIALRRLRVHHERGSVTDDLRGSARRRYSPVGNLDLLPVACEPVIADTGYAGVVISYVDASARVWQLPSLMPGDSGQQVRATYREGTRFAGTGRAVRELARRRLLLSNATASADGRLGAGAGVQAVATDVVPPQTCWARLPEFGARSGPGSGTGPQRLSGPLSLDGTDPVLGDVTVRLSPAAFQLSSTWGVRLARHWVGRPLQAVVRPDVPGAPPTLLALAPEDFTLPKALGGRLFPGLDRLDGTLLGSGETTSPAPADAADTVAARDAAGASSGNADGDADLDTDREADGEVDPTAWGPAPSGDVAVYLARWAGRLLVDGRRAVLVGAGALQVDAARLARGAAPTAAEVLTGLEAGARAGGRRFDGTWEPDDAALAVAFTKVAAYLVSS